MKQEDIERAAYFYMHHTSNETANVDNACDALFALSSFTRISENFPEALPYINFSSVTSIIPNYNNLRNPFKN